mmetsp:Transcript_4267/g.6588  ORF Transcript_4267/g.6588 Transcript_4267/m.6588 type:complete len:424 (-) Transcript_4267:61-1332(-)
MFRSIIISLLLLVPVVTCITECLERNEDLRSNGEEKGAATLRVFNLSPMALFLVWVNEKGQDSSAFTPIQIPNKGGGRVHELTTSIGHAFRIYDEKMGLLKEHVMEEAKMDISINHACHDTEENTKENQFTEDQEMRALVHNQEAPCLPEDESKHWSCIKLISKENYEQRLQEKGGTIYGFKDQEEAQDRAVGETIDAYWGKNIPLIHRVSRGPGYLKISFTKKMKDSLLPWYEMHKKNGPNDSVQHHNVIPGGYSHAVDMSTLWLPRDLKNILVSKMRRVLMWWTQDNTLHETATFGVRIYHRESMLINHVDVAATHIASAVIQIAQNGVGWPLEILHPDGTCSEVYLQPGEMVLYEGARFMHGRPMRFNGTDFANVFTHFRPAFWNGPGNSPKYDGKLNDEGHLIQEKVHENSITEKNDEL